MHNDCHALALWIWGQSPIILFRNFHPLYQAMVWSLFTSLVASYITLYVLGKWGESVVKNYSRRIKDNYFDRMCCTCIRLFRLHETVCTMMMYSVIPYDNQTREARCKLDSYYADDSRFCMYEGNRKQSICKVYPTTFLILSTRAQE